MQQQLDYYSLVGFKPESTSPDELDRLSLAQQTALLVDFDGTLIDIAPTPDSIRVSSADKALLDQLYTRHGGALAIVSGRNLDEIVHYLDTFKGTISGGHGAELRRNARTLPGIDCNLDRLEHIKNAVMEFAVIDPRMIAEDKRFGIVLHFRTHPEIEGKVRDFVRCLIEDDEEFEMQTAKMAIEIKPRDVSKARAIERIMQFDEFHGRDIVFAGDDATDEIAFAWVNGQGGTTIKVGDGVTAAQYRTASPASFKKWLRTQFDSAQLKLARQEN
ncbi:trehalose-phosphatase [Hoeflea sp. Naph1]|uniref:trehalose-phosphatase n=1 Tax=Hoeflea sp. Naph1 TaxID=3388653 RepID=UPI0039903951